VYDPATMPTCLFTGDELAADTRVEHTIPRNLNAGFSKSWKTPNMDRTELQVLREIIPALDILFDFQSSELNAEKMTMKGANTEDRLIQIFLLLFLFHLSQHSLLLLLLTTTQRTTGVRTMGTLS